MSLNKVSFSITYCFITGGTGSFGACFKNSPGLHLAMLCGPCALLSRASWLRKCPLPFELCSLAHVNFTWLRLSCFSKQYKDSELQTKTTDLYTCVSFVIWNVYQISTTFNASTGQFRWFIHGLSPFQSTYTKYIQIN